MFKLSGLTSKARNAIQYIGKRGYLNWIPDRIYLKIVWKTKNGTTLNLDRPVTFNEKINWLKLHDRKTEYTTYVDKYAVREYVSNLIGSEFLIPLIGVYNCVEDINWGNLPNRFVLKCTHGSSCNIICTDKKMLDINRTKKKLKNWMKLNWYWYGREWPYKDVKPRIICEKYIGSEDVPPDDYKVICCNGEPRYILYVHDRFGNRTEATFNIDWTPTNLDMRKKYDKPKFLAQRPMNLSKMLEISRLLSKNTYLVRIDFFEVHGKLYFGEFTLYPTSGFSPFLHKEVDVEVGSWIHLPID